MPRYTEPRRVRCVNSHLWEQRLTLGKVYDVVPNERLETLGQLTVIDNTNSVFTFANWRFEEFKEPANGAAER